MMAVLSPEQDAFAPLMGMAEDLDVEAKDKQGQTAMHLAVMQSNNAAIEKLWTENKASLVVKDAHGLTPLHLAAIYGREVSWVCGWTSFS